MLDLIVASVVSLAMIKKIKKERDRDHLHPTLCTLPSSSSCPPSSCSTNVGPHCCICGFFIDEDDQDIVTKGKRKEMRGPIVN
jgi:hypothetical protein